MHQEHSGLKTLLGEIETLRIKRQREMAHRSHSPWKRFTQQELNDEACPTYKNLLVGRSRRIPDRQTILAISDYLECTSDERNDLLLAAGYLPIQSELKGQALELALERAQHTMRTIPFPAMIVTHAQDIKDLNEPFRRLFDISHERFSDSLMNRIDVHFHPDLPVRTRSTFDKASLEQWQSHAVHGIRAFKQDHLLSRYDAWYQKVIDRAQTYNVLDMYGDAPDAAEAIEPVQTILARRPGTGELVPIRYKQMSISGNSRMHPQIQVFLPVDAAARQVFEELGCPADCRFG